MSADWSITSPLALLDEWQGPSVQDELQDLVLLGFTVNLPFLEKVAIRTARVLGARVTVIGDAAHGVHDPVDVRMRSYFTAWAACRGAFHPKLALLIGEHEITAAIGSGNPTMAGWGHNEELWTVLRSGPDGSAQGLRQVGDWLTELPSAVSMPTYAVNLLGDVAARLTTLPDGDSSVQVLHNLHQGLLSQLPSGPVQELRLYAPFVDHTGHALREIFGRLDPQHVVIGLQENWSSYDGDAILRAAEGRRVEIQFLPEQYPRHGKLLEWENDDGCQALTGSANLTQSAMTRATAAGGNCELAVLAPVGKSQMPDGATVTAPQITGRRTVSEISSVPVILLLGALLTHAGLEVTLARPYHVAVTIEISPDGSPDSWTAIGVVPPERREALIPISGSAGAVVRGTAILTGQGRAESPPIFTVDPARCARRQADDHRPRIPREYNEEDIFTDEELAGRFRYDLLRLAEMLPEQGNSGGSGAGPAVNASAPESVEDRWAAYLADCERTMGRPLVSVLFGSLFQLAPGISSGPGWTIADGTLPDGDDDDEEATGDVPALIVRIPPSERIKWRRWVDRAVLSVTPAKSSGSDFSATQPAVPLLVRCQLARLMIQLLGHGVWDLEDDSWRDTLAQLTVDLAPGEGEDVPDEARQLAATLVAICMSLLRSGASLTGGTSADLIAARSWRCVRAVVAEADPELAEDLLIRPIHSRAVIVNGSELEDTILLAMDDDPASLVTAEFAGRGWIIERDGPLYLVSGAFTNPVSVAAEVATQLGQYLQLVLVHARTPGRWAFMAWRRPDLVLANVPANAWRVYRIDGSFTPASRFAGGEGLPSTGLVGRPVRLGQSPPPTVDKLLAEAGLDHTELLRRLLDDS